MSTHPIILGEPESILQLPKASLRNPSDWTQFDSDILAHLIQVQSQIQQSRWNKSDIRFKSQGNNLLEHSFPAFEDFVFAAVYVRQLIAHKDRLLEDAVNRFCNVVDCRIRPAWLAHEVKSFKNVFTRDAFMLPGYTAREVIDGFMYGAGLLHKFPREQDRKRQKFLSLYDNQPRHKVLYSLNMSMKLLMNHVGNVTVVIYRDYSHWLHDYKLPLPDTRWHSQLFDMKASAQTEDAPP